MSEHLDYAAAGVDTAAGDRAVELMKNAISRTHNSTVVGATGGFAGMVDASALLGMTRPLLATSTDGVGTKIALAQALNIHDTIGQDLVGMVVDDIVVVGARPLLMTDYIACGKVVPEKIAAIVRGIAQACEQVDCPLVGGETAEHPGVMDPDDYDIAGAATGVVDADKMIGPDRVREGDAVIALASSGLHSNGYSLVRRVLDISGTSLESQCADFGRTVGEELLEPTRLYTRVCLDMLDSLGVDEGGLHALSHVTGGGLGANLSRVIPSGLCATVDRGSWTVPAVFEWVRRNGDVTWEALEDSLNLGVGMVAVVGQSTADQCMSLAADAGIEAWVLGEVIASEGSAAERPATERTAAEGSSVERTAAAGHATTVAALSTSQPRLICGAKGVDAGAVALSGSYRVS